MKSKSVPVSTGPDVLRTSDYNGPSTVVCVNAIHCGPSDDGMWEIRVPVRELSREESVTLEKLFPHTIAQMETLLNTEALLAAIQ